MDMPFTRAVASEAIKAGKTSSVDDLISDPLYNVVANRETWANYTPKCVLFTAYSIVRFIAAQDVQRYTSTAPKVAAQMLAKSYHEFSVGFTNYSAELGANDDSVGVIHQGGRLIKAVSRRMRDPKVVESPAGSGAGYSQYVEFTFDARSLNTHKPFTAGMANVVVIGADGPTVGEVDCSFSASAK